ncbi:MAG TPA: ABC transporter permease [Candidatus Dormibacteraeota bacterium]|nr:ABC transporter permease [Candidatus Dormibacteraeota bacterium]
MSVFEAIRLAWQGLLANRLRSSLTMLGILIGVGAVILLVAVGNGASVQVQNQVSALGSNIVYIYPASTRGAGGVSQGFGSGSTLTAADVAALNNPQAAPHIVTAIPVTQAAGNMTYQNQNWFAPMTGSTELFPQVRDYTMAEGAFFTADQVTANSKVVVIGKTVVDNLFQGQDPLGQQIKINRQSFTVIGVFASKGSAALGNQDNIAVVPITTAWTYLTGGRGKNITQIIIQATDANSVTAATQEATSILAGTHQVDPANPDFTTQSQQDILAAAGSITGTLTVLLGAIAAISLVVGGIGIMNIMLVTVTERTREIGIRKAIGARRRDILLQFLIESMVLSGLGGLLGIAAGWLISTQVSAIKLGTTSLPPPIVSLPSVFLAFGVSVGIGLFFGIYPANRAAALHPIEALRYE